MFGSFVKVSKRCQKFVKNLGLVETVARFALLNSKPSSVRVLPAQKPHVLAQFSLRNVVQFSFSVQRPTLICSSQTYWPYLSEQEAVKKINKNNTKKMSYF